MPQPPTLADQRQSSATTTLPSISRREARLRPEYADRYPGIEARVWGPAAVLCDRVLRAEHFEFRGGGPEGQRPRREDR